MGSGHRDREARNDSPLPISPIPTPALPSQNFPGAVSDPQGLTPPLFEVPDLPRLAGQLEDVEAGVGAVDGVDVAALVDLDVVGLDRGLAALLAVLQRDAALVRVLGDRRDVVGDL